MELPYAWSFLDPASAARDTLSKQKTETIRIAKEQEKAIHEKLARNNHPIPKYEFLELIGKGAYGRVFKCLDQAENRIVALKVIDVDSHDYKVNAREKDDSIEVTLHEIKVLKQLKDAKTKNVNVIFDAFQIHSQLWIVNEYCPGGSVRTLMRSTGDRLENKFIVPIARELAVALKAIHDGGIIHRDIKAANVMIHEDGRLQVIDFGVAGVLQTNFDKRSTVIGTPHWMAPELHKLAPREGLTYGTEVDVWAYGCTLYEIATGMPPYPKTQPGRMLGVTLGRAPPRLNDLDHVKNLCDLVAFVLEAKPVERPSMEAVLQHPYILNSEETYPTKSLAELVKIYYRWEHSGGQRQSLFINAGAAAAEFPAKLPEEDDWNFSTTVTFEQEIFQDSVDSSISSQLPSSSNQGNNAIQIDEEDHSKGRTSIIPSIVIPDRSPEFQSEVGLSRSSENTPTGALTPVEKLNTEERVKRGQDALKGLFDEQQAPYKYEVKADFVEQKPISKLGPSDLVKLSSRRSSDLPLRDESVQSSVYRKEFDADQVSSATYDNIPNIDLANVGTIKANRMNRFLNNMSQDNKDDDSFGYASHPEDDKRATKDWTFPATEPEDTALDPKRATKEWTFPSTALDSTALDPKRATIEWGFPPEMPAIKADRLAPPTRPNLRHAVTAPVGEIEHVAEMIDLDALYDDPLYDNTVFSNAPGSDEDVPSQSFARSEARVNEASDDEVGTIHSIDGNKPVTASRFVDDELNDLYSLKSGAPSTISSDSDYAYDSDAPVDHNVIIDPFAFDNEALIEKSRREFEVFLDQQGIMDPLERAKRREEYFTAVRGILSTLDQDLADSGYEEFKQRRGTTAVGGFPEKNHAIWALFDPKVYPDGPPPGLWIDDSQDQPSEPDIPLAQGLKTRITKRNGSGSKPVKHAHYPSASALEAAAQKFPDLVPPSAESLTADAPPEVLEAELKRLLGDWNRGLDVLGDLVTNVDDNIRGVGSNGSNGSNGIGGRGGTKSAAAAAGGHGNRTTTKKRAHGYGNGNGNGYVHGHGHGRARVGTAHGIEDLNDDFDFHPPPADSISNSNINSNSNSNNTSTTAITSAIASSSISTAATATADEQLDSSLSQGALSLAIPAGEAEAAAAAVAAAAVGSISAPED